MRCIVVAKRWQNNKLFATLSNSAVVRLEPSKKLSSVNALLTHMCLDLDKFITSHLTTGTYHYRSTMVAILTGASHQDVLNPQLPLYVPTFLRIISKFTYMCLRMSTSWVKYSKSS
jgi:hypothetical protein